MKRFLTPLAAGVLALSLAACGSDSDSDSAAGPLITAGELKVCSDVPYAPFEIEDPTSPVGFSGFDIDVVQAVADHNDLKLVVVKSGFDAIEGGSALRSKQCDIAASAITINEERQKHLTFSDPYFTTEQSLLVPKGSSIASIKDLDGKKVGVQGATTGDRFAQENATGADVVPFDDDNLLFQALKSKTVDAILQDTGPNTEHAKDGKFVVVETFATDEQYGLAMAQGNDELLEMVNAGLKAMRDSGAYDKAYAQYFS